MNKDRLKQVWDQRRAKYGPSGFPPRGKWTDKHSDDVYRERLKALTKLREETECWEYQRFCHPSKGMEGKDNGYGDMSYRGKTWRTHRLAYFLWVGPIPAGRVVAHTCDNPRCCNPEHLVAMTEKQNMQDAGLKQRWPRQYRATCIHGHPRTPENMVRHGKAQKLNCRVCLLERYRKKSVPLESPSDPAAGE